MISRNGATTQTPKTFPKELRPCFAESFDSSCLPILPCERILERSTRVVRHSRIRTEASCRWRVRWRPPAPITLPATCGREGSGPVSATSARGWPCVNPRCRPTAAAAAGRAPTGQHMQIDLPRAWLSCSSTPCGARSRTSYPQWLPWKARMRRGLGVHARVRVGWSCWRRRVPRARVGRAVEGFPRRTCTRDHHLAPPALHPGSDRTF